MKFFSNLLGGSSEDDEPTSNDNLQPEVSYAPSTDTTDWTTVCSFCNPQGLSMCSYHAHRERVYERKYEIRYR